MSAARLRFQKWHTRCLWSVLTLHPNSRIMLRIAVIVALFCIAVAANVLPISKPLSGVAVSFSKNLKNDEICKICIQESVVMCAFSLLFTLGIFCRDCFPYPSSFAASMKSSTTGFTTLSSAARASAAASRAARLFKKRAQSHVTLSAS